jgi:nicotinamide-nucleotide amidase
VADLIGQPLEYHPEIFELIEKRFTSRGLRTPEINRRQAMVPRGATVLPNVNGTAPGLWIEHGQKPIVLLPGPPREMKPILEAVIQERLRARTGTLRLYRRVLRITGQSESSVEGRCSRSMRGGSRRPSRSTAPSLLLGPICI